MKRKSGDTRDNSDMKRDLFGENSRNKEPAEFFISSKPQTLTVDDDYLLPNIQKSDSIKRKPNIKVIKRKDEKSSYESISTTAIGRKRKQRRADVTEGRTIIIRNLSLNADEKKLHKFLSSFGKLNFVKIVKDKLSRQSRDIAFAKFASKNASDSILLAFSKPENAEKFLFDGKQLNLTLAISPEDLEKQRKGAHARELENKIQSKGNISDVTEARTIFIRNLSFDAEEKRLHQFLSNFGQLEFVKIVKDKLTQHSRGTAFAKFVSKEDTDRILLASAKTENANRFLFAGRPLNLSLAISRDEVEKKQKARGEGNRMVDESEVVVGDGSTGRNLHLARIGMIRPGTQQAEEMTSKEASMRESIMRTKQAKLKNPNIFISPMRICLRNIPLEVDDEILRNACQRIVGPGARITEARVMRDLKSGIQNAKSLGYAFVNFEEHKDAMKAIQVINNNSSVFGGSRKPIVEFSLENSRALDKRKKRAEKSLLLQESGEKRELKQPRKPVPSAMQLGRRMKHKGKKAFGSSRQGMRILPKRFGPKIRHQRRTQTKNKKQKN